MGPPPTTRRILVRGLDRATVDARLTTYEQLDAPGDATLPVALRGPTPGGWLQLDLPDELDRFHFHNLALWLLGPGADEPRPEALLVVVDGPGGYWLRPIPNATGTDSAVLQGYRADQRHYVYDVAARAERDEPRLQATPMTLPLAMMSAGVPMALQDPARAPAVAATRDFTPFRLDAPGANPLTLRAIRWLRGQR